MEYTDQRVRIDYAEQPRLEGGPFYATVRHDPSYRGEEVPPPIVALIGVERSKLTGCLDARNFLRDEAFPFMGIARAAEERFRPSGVE